MIQLQLQCCVALPLYCAINVSYFGTEPAAIRSGISGDFEEFLIIILPAFGVNAWVCVGGINVNTIDFVLHSENRCHISKYAWILYQCSTVYSVDIFRVFYTLRLIELV